MYLVWVSGQLYYRVTAKKGNAAMIKYKCEFCDAKLETDNDMSGTLEACPVCKKGNTVPLSKHDQHELDKQRKEKRRQEQETEKQRKTAAESTSRPTSPTSSGEAPQKPLPVKSKSAKAPSSTIKKKRSLQADLTETALVLAGCICVIIGVAAAVGVLMISAQAEYESRIWVVQAVLMFLGGFLSAMPFFAAQLALKYLRRITKALEAKKQAS